MRIVVTGATGFVGKAVVKSLLTAGHEVVALTRDVERARRELPMRCERKAWDPSTGAIDVDALRGADAIVHLAGEGVADGRWSSERKAAIRESRVVGSQLVMRALAELPAAVRPRILVSASAIGYYGDRGDEELDEESRAGEGFLAEVCEAWEREVFVGRALGLRTVAVRIGIVLGRQGGALRRMLLPFRLGLGGRMGSGRQWMSWIHLDDLVALLCLALEHSDASGVVNAVAPVPVTNADFTCELGHALGRPTLFPVPAFLLRLALGDMSTILLASQRVLPRAAERLGLRFRYPRLAEALADLCHDHYEEVEYEQWVARAPGEVFPFFSDARNLERITPQFLRFHVLGLTTPEMRKGTRIDYRLSLHGIPVRWQSRIETWEPGRRFVDCQTRGPYRCWHHTHEFEPHDGGTLIRDRVRYELPFGSVGELVAGRLVARDVRSIFDFRRAKIDELLGRHDN